MTVNPNCKTMLHRGGHTSANGVPLQDDRQDGAMSAYC
jgi:hypothetical protein